MEKKTSRGENKITQHINLHKRQIYTFGICEIIELFNLSHKRSDVLGVFVYFLTTCPLAKLLNLKI